MALCWEAEVKRKERRIKIGSAMVRGCRSFRSHEVVGTDEPARERVAISRGQCLVEETRLGRQTMAGPSVAADLPLVTVHLSLRGVKVGIVRHGRLHRA